MESSVVDVKQSSVVIPGPVRRSQAPVPKVAGQLRLVAGGACIPAQSKVRSPFGLTSCYHPKSSSGDL